MSYERRRREKLQDRILFSSCKAYLATWQNIMFLGPMGTLALWWDIIGDGAVQISDSYLGNARLAGPEVKVEIRMEQISQSACREGLVVLSCVTLCCPVLHSVQTVKPGFWSIAFHSDTSKYIMRIQKTTLFWLTIEKLFSTQWK